MTVPGSTGFLTSGEEVVPAGAAGGSLQGQEILIAVGSQAPVLGLQVVEAVLELSLSQV